jgi:hypothetical protein
MTLTSMSGMGGLYQHVFARNENSGINVRTHTDQQSDCTTVAGTSGISDSCTANSNDNVMQSGGIVSPNMIAQGPVRCPTSLTFVLSTVLFVTPPQVFISGNLTDTCTGQGVPGATITFTRVSGDVPVLPPTVTGPPPFGIFTSSFASFPGASGTLRAHFAGNAQLEPSTATQSFTVP